MPEMRVLEYRLNGITHTAQFTEAGAKLRGLPWGPVKEKTGKSATSKPEAPESSVNSDSGHTKAAKTHNKSAIPENK